MTKKYIISRSICSRRIDYRADLNPDQFAVVTAGEGPTLVIAGPGSGKTRTLTYRLGYLLDMGVPASSIVLCTFTNKAAKEMLHRVERLVQADARRVLGGTFHHLANRLLRRYVDCLGYQSDYTILDQNDSRELLGSCLTGVDRGRKNANRVSKMLPRPEVLADLLSFSINTQTALDMVIMKRVPTLVPLLDDLLAIARQYRSKKLAMNVMDFDDLLVNLKRLLLEHPSVREELCSGFRSVLVDEYQDTNVLQCELVDLLASFNRNLTVVGDDAQSIYGFRGADQSNMLSFSDRWPDSTLYRLEMNYRSVPEVLGLANRSIRYNRNQLPKELRAVRSAGQLPVYVTVRDPRAQVVFVAQRVLELIDEGMGLDEIAVLYRAHSQSLDLQVELTHRKIPYMVRSGVRFFEQAHIKDVLAYLRLVQNPKDELSWIRVLRIQPGIGKTTATRIWELLSKSNTPLTSMLTDLNASQFPQRSRLGIEQLQGLLRVIQAEQVGEIPALSIQKVMEHGYAELLANLYVNPNSRKEDIEQLVAYAEHYQSTLAFLSELNLQAGIGTEEILSDKKPQEQLTLTTVHQAKGLEWKVVFILSLNEGTFPHPWALSENNGDDQEERRLFYVALTRSKDQLYLISMLTIERAGGRRVLLRPSRFLEELGGEPPCVELWSVEEERGG